MEYLIHHCLRRTAAQFPEKTALKQHNISMCYRDLERNSDALAWTLVHSGAQRGDRVAVFLDHSLDQVLSFWSIVKAGCVFVPINSLLLAPQAEHIAKDCEPFALIIDSNRLEMLRNSLGAWPFLKQIIVVGEIPLWVKNLPIKCVSWDAVLAESGKAVPSPDRCIGLDLAALLYTSGSTGRPKGVMVSHDNLLAGARIVTSYLRNRPDDRLLGVLPLSFDYGLNQVTCSALLGMTYVMTSFRFPGELVDVLIQEQITGFAGIPTIWLLLLQRGSPVFKKKFPHLRYITNSGGFLPPSAIDQLRHVFPGTEIFLMYGLTEAFRSTYLPPEEIDARPTSIGKAIPGCEILVVSKDGRLCAPGEVGELVHRGPTVSLGYWGDREKTEKVFRPHPFLPEGLAQMERVVYSGDLVKKDDEGYLYFVGRDDHMIKCHGHRISPSEIEDVLYEGGRVKLAAAIGVPDPIRGQSVKVFVVPQDGESLSEEEVRAYCAEKLPVFMLPRYVEIRRELPRTPTGKIDVARLRAEESTKS
ncbi:MAG: acyl-CoA ligase (AMP-forming), exosortase A system-associated [Desulfosoma sp.]